MDCGASPQVVLTSTYLLIKLLFVYFLKYFSLRQILVLWPPYILHFFSYSLSTAHSPTTQTVISSPGSKLRRCPWSWWIGALLVYQEVNCWRIFKMKFSWRRRRSCTFQRKIIRSKNVAEYFCMLPAEFCNQFCAGCNTIVVIGFVCAHRFLGRLLVVFYCWHSTMIDRGWYRGLLNINLADQLLPSLSYFTLQK